jgi:hypothetical protein
MLFQILKKANKSTMTNRLDHDVYCNSMHRHTKILRHKAFGCRFLSGEDRGHTNNPVKRCLVQSHQGDELKRQKMCDYTTARFFSRISLCWKRV